MPLLPVSFRRQGETETSRSVTRYTFQVHRFCLCSLRKVLFFTRAPRSNTAVTPRRLGRCYGFTAAGCDRGQRPWTHMDRATRSAAALQFYEIDTQCCAFFVFLKTKTYIWPLLIFGKGYIKFTRDGPSRFFLRYKINRY